MKIALISSRKVIDIADYLPPDCTEILTNIPELGSSVTFNENIEELIKNADYVIVVANEKGRHPAVCAKCKKYGKSFEIRFI